MGDFSNQFYLVTIDEKWKENVDSRVIPIITDGTYFIHQLNNILIAVFQVIFMIMQKNFCISLKKSI